MPQRRAAHDARHVHRHAAAGRATARWAPASVQNSQSPDAFNNWLTSHGYTM